MAVSAISRIERLEARRRTVSGCPTCARGVGVRVVIVREGEQPRTDPDDLRPCPACGRLAPPRGPVIVVRREADPPRLGEKGG